MHAKYLKCCIEKLPKLEFKNESKLILGSLPFAIGLITLVEMFVDEMS
jgi:hypothetical protein